MPKTLGFYETQFENHHSGALLNSNIHKLFQFQYYVAVYWYIADTENYWWMNEHWILSYTAKLLM